MRTTGYRWILQLTGFTFVFVACALGFGLATSAIVGSSAPAADADIMWRLVLPALIASLAATWVLAMLYRRRADGALAVGFGSALGLRPPLATARESGLGALLGVAVVGLAVILIAAPGWLTWQAGPGAGLAAALNTTLLLVAAAWMEEILFRGYPFQVLSRRFGPVVAILATSVAFGVAHLGNPGIGPLALVNIILAGAWLGVARWRTGSLWFATGAHLGWNWVLAATGLEVSGLDIPLSGLEPQLAGPALWTGAGFGPEGGLAVTLAVCLGTWWLWRVVAPSRR